MPPKIGIRVLNTSLILVLCAMRSVSFAEGDIEDLFGASLEELLNATVISAGKHEQRIQDASSVVSIITAQDIERFGGNSLYEVLDRATGVLMTGSFFFPKNVASIRGDLLTHTDNHVLILLNGRPMRESFSGGDNFSIYNGFPLDIVQRIEIIRGPGSVLYGTNAYSGVINIMTKTAEEADRQISVQYGSFTGLGSDASWSYSSSEFQVVASLKYFSEEGWNLAAVDDTGSAGSIDMGEDNFGLFANIRFNGFTLNTLYTSSRQDFMGASTRWAGTPPAPDRDIQSDRFMVDLEYRFDYGEDLYLNANVGYALNRFKHFNYDASSNDASFEITNHWQVSESLRWLAGGTVWRQYVDSNAGLLPAPVASFDATWWSAYSELEWQAMSRLSVTAGLQIDKVPQIDAETVPRLGIVYHRNDNLGFKLLHGRAFRSAFAVETGFDFILRDDSGNILGGLRGNPTLEPEKVATTDLQVFFAKENYEVSATVFYSEQRDLISRERAADRVIDFVNKGELDIWGVEAEGKARFSDRWFLVGSILYQQNENNGGIDDFTLVPSTMLKVGVSHRTKSGVSIGLFNSLIGAWSDLPSGSANGQEVRNPPSSSYNLLTGKVGFDLPDAIFPAGSRVEFYGYNLLDEEIFQTEFVGRNVNTLPSHSGRALYARISVKY